MIYAWTKANQENVVPGGLLLDNGYTLANFQSDVDALREQPLTTTTAVLSTSGDRDARNDLLLPARDLMKLYANAIRALYSPESNEVKTLPTLWEKEDDDPDAPKLKVEYTDGSSSAKASWSQIVDPTVTKIYVSIAPGARYSSKNARRLAELAPGVLDYTLPEGTIAPGSTNWLKIFAVDSDGDEVGSNTVKIVRAS